MGWIRGKDIKNNAVGTEHIEAASITAAKLAPDAAGVIGVPAADSLTTAMLQAGSVTPEKEGLAGRNETGATLLAGALVYASSWSEVNGKPLLVLADADAVGRGDKLYVVVTQILNAANGVVYRGGDSAANLDTSLASAVGDKVYLSTTAGSWTLTAPSGADDDSIVIGFVRVVDAAVGRIHWNLSAGTPLLLGTNRIQALAVTGAKMAAGAVTAGKIGVGGISAADQFAAGVVDSAALAGQSAVVIADAGAAKFGTAGLDLLLTADGTDVVVTGTGDLVFVDGNDIKIGTGKDIGIEWDGTRLNITQAAPDSEIRLGVSGAGIDVVHYGDTAGYDIVFDQSRNAMALRDNAKIEVGTGADLTISHDGTNTTMTSAVGDFIIDNTDINDQVIIRVGTDDTATGFEIRNNSDTAILTVTPVSATVGIANLTGTMNLDGALDLDHVLTGTGDLANIAGTMNHATQDAEGLDVRVAQITNVRTAGSLVAVQGKVTSLTGSTAGVDHVCFAAEAVQGEATCDHIALRQGAGVDTTIDTSAALTGDARWVMADAVADALTFEDSAGNNFLVFDTLANDGITLGNAVTNPAVTMLGTGGTDVSAGTLATSVVTVSTGASFTDNAYTRYGTGNDILVAWDATKLAMTQAAPDSAFHMGISGAGIDLNLFGDTVGRDLTWDQSADSLIFGDSAKAVFGTGSDITILWDGTRLNVVQLTANSEIRYGVDGAGIDHRFYTDTVGSDFLIDQSADALILEGVAHIVEQTIVAANGAAIPVTHSGGLPITQNGAETNTLADPTFRGQRITIYVDTDTAGARVITAASRINQAGNQIITMTEVGDCIELVAITIAGALKWQVSFNEGCALT